MGRPAKLLSGNTLYWTIRLYSDSQVLVDADSTPTVAVRKNGASTADAVTVTKRASTTGIYDCSYNPAGEAEGDQYTLEESATVSAVAYENNWTVVVAAVERGTDGANTVTPNTVAPDNAGIAANGNAIAGLNDFDPSADTVANVTTVGSVTSAVTTDAASRTASQADVSALATSASIAALNDLSQADIRTSVGLASANLDTQLGDIPTVSEFEARTLVAASYFDPSADSVTTDAASRTASQADVSALATAASIAALNDFDPATEQVVASNMRGTDNANTIAPVDVSADVTAVKAVVDKLDTAMQLDGAVYQFTTNALERAPASGSGGVVGPGAISHTVTVNSGGNPVDGAEVWVTTDAAGNSVIAGTLVTDAFGRVTFTLDAGTYYLWAQKAGVNFTNPVSFEVE